MIVIFELSRGPHNVSADGRNCSCLYSTLWPYVAYVRPSARSSQHPGRLYVFGEKWSLVGE